MKVICPQCNSSVPAFYDPERKKTRVVIHLDDKIKWCAGGGQELSELPKQNKDN